MARLFAYGSLMWDNALAAYDGQRARAEGLRRAFVGESTGRWGTPDHPCPQIGLVPGEGCDGVVFEIPRFDRRLLYRNLRRREGRRPRGVRVRLADGRRRRASSLLPGPGERVWPEDGAVIDALRAAKGAVGTGPEYVRTLVHAMELWGIRDPLIEHIWEEVRN